MTALPTPAAASSPGRSAKLQTPEARVSHPHCHVPRPNTIDPSKPDKYECSMVFPPGTDLTAMRAAAAQAVQTMWNGTPPFPVVKDPFLDAHEKQPTLFPPGSVLIRTSKTLKSGAPPVVDHLVQPINEASFYGGCYARFMTNAYCWKTQTGCGVSFGLISAQKTRDGEPFGHTDDPTEDFKPFNPESLGAAAPVAYPATAPVAPVYAPQPGVAPQPYPAPVAPSAWQPGATVAPVAPVAPPVYQQPAIPPVALPPGTPPPPAGFA